MKSWIKSNTWFACSVVVLAFIGVTNVIGTVILVLMKQAVSEIVIALGSAAIGCLAGFLVPTHLSQSPQHGPSILCRDPGILHRSFVYPKVLPEKLERLRSIF